MLERLRVSLRLDGVDQVELETPGHEDLNAAARISIEPTHCTAEATEFTVTVDDALTRNQCRRTSDLIDTPEEQRQRTLGQITSNLLRACWNELQEDDEDRLVRTTLPPRIPVPERVRNAVRARLAEAAARARARRERASTSPFVTLQTEFRSFPWLSTEVVGARLNGGISVPWQNAGRRIRIRVDAGASFGGGRSSLGTGDLLLLTGAVAVTFGRNETLGYEFGPRIEAGLARATGIASPERNSRGSYVIARMSQDALVTLGGIIALRGHLSENICATLEADLGWAFGGVNATSLDQLAGTETPMFGASGPSVALRLGIGWDP
jgi:hypothetical protein